MFYGGAERGATVESIIRSLRADVQLIQVSGEPGSGKTMLSLVLADRIKQHYNILRYDHPELSTAHLLRHLLIELCPQHTDLIAPDSPADAVDVLAEEAAQSCIVEKLQSATAGNKPFVLMMDTEGEMTAGVLRLLEVIASARQGARAAMHIIVFRRVPFDEFRSSFDLTRLSQGYWPSGPSQPDTGHGTCHNYLRRLSLAEVNEYLCHHMLLFDFNRRDLFTRGMAYFIADQSAGLFRSINTLARNAFTIASLENSDRPSMSHLLMAGLPARENKPPPPVSLKCRQYRMIALFSVGVVASLVAGMLFMQY
jgi:type II secretory pathway predicted ATPase ExeA